MSLAINKEPTRLRSISIQCTG